MAMMRPWRSRSFEVHFNSIQNRGGFFWKILSPLRFIVFLIPLVIKVIPNKYFHPQTFPSNYLRTIRIINMNDT